MINFQKMCKTVCVLAVGFWLAGCADMQSASHSLAARPQKIGSLAVWSDVGSLVYVTGPTSPSKPFSETFRHSLVSALSAQGVSTTYRDVRHPGRLSTREIAQLAAQDGSNVRARLLIEVKSTVTTPAAFAHVDRVSYVLTLISTTTNERVWQAGIVMSAGIEIPQWNESNAAKFANEIVSLLKKDGYV